MGNYWREEYQKAVERERREAAALKKRQEVQAWDWWENEMRKEHKERPIEHKRVEKEERERPPRPGVAVKVVDLDGGDAETVYESAAQAAQALGCKSWQHVVGTMRNGGAIKGRWAVLPAEAEWVHDPRWFKGPLSGRWIFRKWPRTSRNTEYLARKAERLRTGEKYEPHRRYKVLDIDTGEVTECLGVEAVEAAIGDRLPVASVTVSKAALLKSVLRGRFMIFRKDEEPVRPTTLVWVDGRGWLNNISGRYRGA